MSGQTSISGKNIILGVSGSIAAFKAVELAGMFVKEGAEVSVIMTEAAQEFVRPLSFEAITHNTVYTGMFKDHVVEPRHIGLAERADIIIAAPATANGIGKWALGLADDLLSCTVMACNAPLLIAPAMNDLMYKNPATQANIDTLKQRGATFVGPVEGRLASGKIGQGRFAPLENIFNATVSILSGTENVC
jgi:phosphopantothenoylcysteine decarboxylase/phosphopantothenate--cysteine ligase